MFKPGFLELAYRYRYPFNSASICWFTFAGMANYSNATATVFNPSGI